MSTTTRSTLQRADRPATVVDVLADYAGARGRIAWPDVRSLDPTRYAVQPKVDGAYAQLHLDRAGRVERVVGRAGEIWAGVGATHPVAAARSLLGCQVGRPRSVLVGELESHTEAGNRASQTRGFPVVHLHDVIRDGDEYVARLPYRTRRDRLCRAVAELECEDPDRSWTEDRQGRVHDAATGRYVVPVPRSWRRAPVIEQVPPRLSGELWERVEVGQLEGVVVVDLSAPVGARRGKQKCKLALTLDAVVADVGRRTVRCVWRGRVVTVGRAGLGLELELNPGDVVEIRCDGFYERTSLPRFARLVRRRGDLRSCDAERPI